MPAADEVWRLQRDDEPECRWFREAVRGDRSPSRGSMQGTYVLTPGGECLGRINSGDPEKVASMLTAALTKWRARPAPDDADAAAPPPAPGHRWEQSYPSDGLVLERFARDVGAAPTEEPRRPVNRDAVWFSAEEATGWLPGEPEVGQKGKVAPIVVLRLARTAFVDNVRGQTLPFAAAEIDRADLLYTVRAVDDEHVAFELRGTTRAEAGGPWLGGESYWRPKREWPRSLATGMRGHAIWDRTARRFVAFELVALGTRRGRTAFNGRAREEAASMHRIGFALRLAPAEFRVAPTFVNVYDADWVTHPAK